MLVVGDETPAATVAWQLQDETDSEFECVGIVRSPDNERGSSNGAVTGDLDGLTETIAATGPDIVVLANSDQDPEPIFNAVAWNEQPISVVDLPHFYEHAFGRVPSPACRLAGFSRSSTSISARIHEW